MKAAGAGAANESCVLSALWMVLLSERRPSTGGAFRVRVEAVLAKCKATLFCPAYEGHHHARGDAHVVDRASHLAEFEGEHGTLLRRAAAIAAPLAREPRAAVGVVRGMCGPPTRPRTATSRSSACGRAGSAPKSWARPVLPAWLRPRSGGALSTPSSATSAHRSRPPSYFANDAHYYSGPRQQEPRRRPEHPARAAGTGGHHARSLLPTARSRSRTWACRSACSGRRPGTRPSRASWTRGAPPRGFGLDARDTGARRAFFDLCNNRATVHTELAGAREDPRRERANGAASDRRLVQLNVCSGQAVRLLKQPRLSA